MRSSRLLPLFLGFVVLLGLGWFAYQRALGPALDRMLLTAVARGNLPKATELLDQGANPNARDTRSVTALEWALMTKNTPMCKLLLERGAEFARTQAFTGMPLFSMAVMLGDPELVKAFLARGADPRMALGQYMGGVPVRVGPGVRRTSLGDAYSPLRLAAQQGHVAVLKVLLEAGVPVDEESPKHYTALTEAAEHDKAAVVQLLIARGADTEHLQSNETPLIRACRMRNWKAAQGLIAAGANVNARDRGRWTALHWTARRQYLPTMQLLVAKGASVDARDGTGRTPLMWASLYGNVSVVQWLLAHGADSMLLDPRKHSALDLARHYRRPDVERLLEAARGERDMARN